MNEEVYFFGAGVLTFGAGDVAWSYFYMFFNFWSDFYNNLNYSSAMDLLFGVIFYLFDG